METDSAPTTETVKRALWDAVDELTKPTKMRITREAEQADWVNELVDDVTAFACDIAAYRAATAGWGTVPSLWDQATYALGTGTETSEGGSRTPLRERSPADLDLMETRLTIRETVEKELRARRVKGKGDVPDQLRQLAGHIATNDPDPALWAFKFGQWSRLLGNYLRAVDNGPRPIRLRNAPCPACGVKEIKYETSEGTKVGGPIRVDFSGEHIRAATCEACGYTKWRGQDLWDLADEIVFPKQAVDTGDADISA